MALATSRTVSFDQQSMRLLRRLVDAQEKANRLKEKELELLRKDAVFNQRFSNPLIWGDEQDGLDEKIREESGFNEIDRQKLEDAVAEGDDPDVLDH